MKLTIHYTHTTLTVVNTASSLLSGVGAQFTMIQHTCIVKNETIKQVKLFDNENNIVNEQ